MALPDLTGQNIQDTYKRILQIGANGQVFDGTGSLAPILRVTASYAISSSVEITKEVSSSHADLADGLTGQPSIYTTHITASGHISASATSTGSFGYVNIDGTLALGEFSNVSASLAAAVAGGDNLGNHTATQNLNMDGFDIANSRHITASGNISG